jgi:hypothetical protein
LKECLLKLILEVLDARSDASKVLVREMLVGFTAR